MKKNSQNVLQTPSVLSFERKLDPSDALLYGGSWEKRENFRDWRLIEVREKSVRGTNSHRQKTTGDDPAKLDSNLSNPNLQHVDVATLQSNEDTLKVCFTLKVLGNIGKPAACNEINYHFKLLSAVETYVKSYGFSEISARYAYNIANGRFLWRNKIGAESVEVIVEQLIEGQVKNTIKFNSLKFSNWDFSVPEEYKNELKMLSDMITDGFQGNAYVLLRISAFARIGSGQEVYPSQELILDKSNKSKSKILYRIHGNAGIHSQKIGNALRTIDTWHSYSHELGPIPVEPFGSVTNFGKACRRSINDKNDFYTFLDNWILKDQIPPRDQQNYVIAMLIRGGVFGESNKEK